MIYMTRADLERLNILREDIRMETEALRKLAGANPRTAALIPAIKADIEHKRKLMEIERDRVQQYVDEIDDPDMQKLIEARYLKGIPLYQAAWAIGKDYTMAVVSNKILRFVYARSGTCQKSRRRV